MDVALSGQWSGMPSFSLIILIPVSIKVLKKCLFLDKSVYWSG